MHPSTVKTISQTDHKIRSIAICSCVPLLFIAALHAAPTNWRTEVDSIRQVVKATEDSTAKLVAQINAWKKRGSGRLSGRQQVQWALLMASLNGNFQTLITYSDQYESARKLAPQEFVHRFGGGNDSAAQAEAAIEHLRLLTSLLEADRVSYAITESLRAPWKFRHAQRSFERRQPLIWPAVWHF
jgi:hypothetical protein